MVQLVCTCTEELRCFPSKCISFTLCEWSNHQQRGLLLQSKYLKTKKEKALFWSFQGSLCFFLRKLFKSSFVRSPFVVNEVLSWSCQFCKTGKKGKGLLFSISLHTLHRKWSGICGTQSFSQPMLKNRRRFQCGVWTANVSPCVKRTWLCNLSASHWCRHLQE